MKYSIGHLSGVVKPKYRVISTILGEDFDPKDGLDVFIDLDAILLSAISSQKYRQCLPFESDITPDIVSTMLFTLKHWKDYTRKYNNVRLFLLSNKLDKRELYENKHMKTYLLPLMEMFSSNGCDLGGSVMSQIAYHWGEALKVVGKIIEYVPGAYLITPEKCDSYIIPNIVDDYNKNKRERIIISKTSLMTNYLYTPRTHVIYSRYKATGMCQLSNPLMIVQSLTKIDDDIMTAFTTNRVFFNMLNAIVGDKHRGLMGVTQMGITAFAETLIRSVERGDIPKDPKSIESVLPCVKEGFREYLIQTYPLIDIGLHTQLIPESYVKTIRTSIVDRYDMDSLHKFSIDGLNLMELV